MEQYLSRFAHSAPRKTSICSRTARLSVLRNVALTEYNCVLRIYADLILDGIIPDEAEWLNAQAASRSPLAPTPPTRVRE
jgi:hypothetical protein